MLGRLYIESFLFIRDVELDFGEGLNVITGETGTGKSMTLSALEFVGGKQGNYEEGTAVEVEIIKDGEAVILRREIKKGRSRYYLNGRGTSKDIVKEILKKNISIQGQNEFINLLKEDFQRKLLDKFAKLDGEIKELEKLYEHWKKKEEDLRNFLLKREEILQKRDYYTFRVREFEELGVSLEEYENLRKKGEILKNLEKLRKYVVQSLEELYEVENSAYERVGNAIKFLERVEAYGEKFKESAERLREMKELLFEVYTELKHSLPELSEEELNEVNEKLYRIQRLEEKYKKPFPEIVKDIEEIKEFLKDSENLEGEEEHLREEAEKVRNEYLKLAYHISEKRKKAAKLLEEKIKDLFKELNLEKAGLKVRLSEGEPTKEGIDRIEFLFSSYGKDFKGIEETASGGELSRLFLALSLILPATPVYVFDEVDAGVSGETSLKLAKFLKKLSRKMQVIVVTHSAPLCAAGDKNFKTEKEFIGDIPLIRVRELSPKEKLEEVARLMGLKSEKTLEGARELISIFVK